MMLLLLRTVQPEVQAQARDKKSQSNPQHLAISQKDISDYFHFRKKIFLVISISQKDISVSLNPIIEKGQLPSAHAGFPAQMFPPMILNDTEMYHTVIYCYIDTVVHWKCTTVIQCYNSNYPQCTVHCYRATLLHCYSTTLVHWCIATVLQCAAPLII